MRESTTASAATAKNVLNEFSTPHFSKTIISSVNSTNEDYRNDMLCLDSPEALNAWK